ncbi:polysaccharide deacetylase family protein [Marinobacter salinisoli]|uniref:Polysaccharide deacetylase family protein n=1 Tax=Marinobacter salinisoli TaxID=2769486 RepID=A0ABX7MWL3_9GAMM|nr:polysaccharide deacetylase family protein [Marinobacter salinisoli]
MLASMAWLRIKLSSQPALIILTYHRVLPPNDPERKFEQPGMVTDPQALQRHINLMKSIGAVPIHLDEWLSKRNQQQRLPRLSVAFTFDDGWQDNFQHAYPVLKKHRIPATIFLVTRLLDTTETFWPEQVLRLLTTGHQQADKPEFQWLAPYLPEGHPSGTPLTLEAADEVIVRLKQLDDRTILRNLRTMAESGLLSAFAPERRSILSEEEVNEMASDGLIRFGAHTRHHYRLNRLDSQAALEEEISGCLNDLHTLPQGVVPIFCYPNGDITTDGEQLVRRIYQAACTTKTGWNRSNRNRYDLHRFNLHDGNSGNSRSLLSTIGRGLL